MRPRTRSRASRAAPLAGRDVVVTRPAGQMAPLSRRLVALGARALPLPASAIRPMPDVVATRRALRHAAHASIVVFTSANAVREAWRAAPRWRPARIATVFAIGAATRRALARHGVAARAPADGADSEALLRDPALARPRDVAIVTAPGGRGVLADALRARGAAVALVEVYRRVAARWDRRHLAPLAAARGALASVWSSSEALTAIHARLPPATWRRLAGGVAVVASARIAAVARAAGLRHVVVARSALAADLVAALHAASITAPARRA